MAACMLSVNATVYRGLPEPSEGKQQNAHLNCFVLLSGVCIHTVPLQEKTILLQLCNEHPENKVKLVQSERFVLLFLIIIMRLLTLQS